MRVCLTIDLEQDCPPYLDTWRGAREGTPILLSLLREEDVPATFFTTGQTARRFPDALGAIVAEGHEVGCHGDTHLSFARMDEDAAAREIGRATATLRERYPVVSFRAPYLQFPPRFLGLLTSSGYRLDSSHARYKRLGAKISSVDGLTRVPASVTSSLLRVPSWPRNLVLAAIAEPAVLFVHPWEFVDLRRERLRLDCRFRTGATAVACLRDVIRFFKRRGARFARMQDLL